jgi:hypothetical protein
MTGLEWDPRLRVRTCVIAQEAFKDVERGQTPRQHLPGPFRPTRVPEKGAAVRRNARREDLMLVALRAPGRGFLFTQRFALSLCEIHIFNSRTRWRSLEAVPIRRCASVGLNCGISVAIEMARRRSPPRGAPADPRLAGLGLNPPVLASLFLLVYLRSVPSGSKQRRPRVVRAWTDRLKRGRYACACTCSARSARA